MEWLGNVLWYSEDEKAILKEERDPPLLLRHSLDLPIENGVRVVYVPPSNISVQEQLPVIVLLHGLGGQACQFSHLIDYLAFFCGVLAIDLPGHGKSKPPKSEHAYSPQGAVDVCKSAISQLVDPGTKLVFIGHSLGSILALRLATAYGDRCIGTVAITPPCPDPSKPPVTKNLQTVLKWMPPMIFDVAFRSRDRIGGLASPSVRRMVSKETTNPKVLTEQWRINLLSQSKTVLRTVAYMQPFTEQDAQKVNCPVLVMSSDGDKVCPGPEAERLVQWLGPAIAGTKSVLIRHAGHAVLFEQPEILQGIIAEWFVDRVCSKLSLSHYLAVESAQSDKWSLKNEQKWKAVLSVGDPVCRIRGMKTLRQDDPIHGPVVLENTFPSISDIIDISRDSPPYDPKSFKRIKYHKFPTISKIPPDKEETQDFIDLLKSCLTEGNGEVGIHCHYGFNRTGFLICSYLITEQNYTVKEALHAFATSRQPGIRHQHFIDELFLRYSS